MATTRGYGRTRVAIVVVLVFGALAWGAATLKGSFDSAAESTSFTGLLRTVNYDYDPVSSPKELRAMADLVVVGSFVDATQGRTIHGIGSHVTLVVAVDKVIAGRPDLVRVSRVYVELPEAAGAATAEFRARLPKGRVVLFLDDRTDVAATGATGRPEGTPIFAPFTQGIILEAGTGYLGGIEDIGPMGPDWTRARTLDEFVADLAS